MEPDFAAPAPPLKRAALWEDFIDILYAPSSVFARRQNQGFVVPWLIVSVVLATIMFFTYNAMAPLIEAEVTKGMATAMAKNPQMTEAQAQTARGWGLAIAHITVVIGGPLSMIVVGGVTWVVGMMFGARQTLNSAFLIVTYAYVPKVLGAIVGGLQALMMDVSSLTSVFQLSLSPARFLDPATTSRETLTVLSRLDLFTIWETVIIGVGFMVLGKMPPRKATLAAVALYLLGSVLPLVGLLRAS